MDAQRMTSLEIAQVTGKMHKDVMKAIRNMEPAWEMERGRKFALTQIREAIPNGGYRYRPAFVLSKTECLYVATKFNDQARARLVLRWRQLEEEGLPKPLQRRGDQKLLGTEKEILQQGDEIRRQLIGDENADADGCLTVSEIAKLLETTVKAVNRALVAKGIQFWNGGRYKLTEEYADRGLAKDRAFHYYSLDGEKKKRFYLVWTPIGMELIKTMI